jgi:hypothetical protein
MCLLTNFKFPLASRLLWCCHLHSGLEVLASADCMKGDCGVDIYAKMNTEKKPGAALAFKSDILSRRRRRTLLGEETSR